MLHHLPHQQQDQVQVTLHHVLCSGDQAAKEKLLKEMNEKEGEMGELGGKKKKTDEHLHDRLHGLRHAMFDLQQNQGAIVDGANFAPEISRKKERIFSRSSSVLSVRGFGKWRLSPESSSSRSPRHIRRSCTRPKQHEDG